MNKCDDRLLGPLPTYHDNELVTRKHTHDIRTGKGYGSCRERYPGIQLWVVRNGLSSHGFQLLLVRNAELHQKVLDRPKEMRMIVISRFEQLDGLVVSIRRPMLVEFKYNVSLGSATLDHRDFAVVVCHCDYLSFGFLVRFGSIRNAPQAM